MLALHPVQSQDDLIVTPNQEVSEDEPTEVVENSDASEPEVNDPVLESMESKIAELKSRLPGLYPAEQLRLANLLERRMRWKELMEKHPDMTEEFGVKQKKGKKREKKIRVEETASRKSARLSKEQPIDIPDDQVLEQGHVEEVENTDLGEVLETKMMARSLVAEIVNGVLGEVHTCEVCGKVFRCKWNLVSQHIKQMHTSGQLPFKCSKGFCKEQFATKYEMVGHLLTCSFTCEYCGKLITRSNRVEGHIKRCKGLG